MLAGTVEDHELLDPTLSSERLLYRLFHEHDVRVFEGQRIVESCRCSRERILTMLARFKAAGAAGHARARRAHRHHLRICSTHYNVEPAEVEAAGMGSDSR